MIIAGIDLTTKEGLQKFNKEHEGRLLVTKGDDGSFTLEGICDDQPTITYDSDTNMFDVEDNK